MPAAAPKAFGYLTEPARRLLAGGGDDAPQKKEFLRWVEHKAKTAASPAAARRYAFTHGEWVKFGNGEPVGVRYIELLREFLAERGYAADAGPIHHDCPPPDRRAAKDVCGFGWITFAGWLEKHLLGRTHEPCATAADARAAALMTLEAISRYYTPPRAHPKAGEAAVAHGEAAVGLPREELAAAFERWRAASPNSVWFVTAPGGGLTGPRGRVGVSVVLPVTPDAARRFLAGGLENTDFAAADLACPSRHLFAFASVTVPCPKRLGRFAHDYARMDAVMRQLAVLLPPLAGAERAPDVFGFAGSPECSRMLKDYGFREHGTFTPRRRHPVMTLETSDLMAGVMLAVMKEYQRRTTTGL